MDKLEKLEDESENAGVEVVSYKFDSPRIKGLYCDGIIAISDRIRTRAEKTCVLAEELGHHFTSAGDIINMNSSNHQRQELRARLWAYNKQMGLIGIIKAHEYGCMDQSEMADYLDVTEEFLQDAIECYRSKYGIYVEVDNYIIGFEPYLYVFKSFQDY